MTSHNCTLCAISCFDFWLLVVQSSKMDEVAKRGEDCATFVPIFLTERDDWQREGEDEIL